MDGGADIDAEAETAGSVAGEGALPQPVRRPPGRPRGTNYRRIDAPLHEEMRRMVEQGVVPSITAAARELAWKAYPPSSERASRAKRLAATYPWPAPWA